MTSSILSPSGERRESERTRETQGNEDEDRRRFWASFGSWEDDRTTEEIIEDIYRSRRCPGKEGPITDGIDGYTYH